MKYLREFETEADITIDAYPNVILVNDTKSVFYNYVPKGVFIQHIDGSLYSVDEWGTAGYSNDLANGVAVSTDNARFVIAKTSLGTMSWSSNTSTLVDGILTTTDSNVAKTDFVGYENTQLMLATDTSKAGYSCANYTFPNGDKGYLPALGEWNEAYKNKAAINAAMTAIGGDAIPTSSHWSSTQYSANRAWGLAWGIGTTSNYGKGGSYGVRAFSALKL